ncbi:LptF/LptG family permease [Geminisphaera colitermitum]|uniref:LptF/LptG family permease n=1 Tax=Geminisphaera colitermitum TaxID=1148786 RepID=UPI0001965209|nr:LptF/LptG family permease [Geminisphaera colitermitum]
MKILQRHIFLSVLTTCFAAVLLFTFVLIVGNALKDLLQFALAGQITMPDMAKLLLLLVPYVVAFALPIGVLTGVLLVLGRMSGNSEITAMRAAGLGIAFVTRPILLLAVAGSVICLIVNYYYMPMTRKPYKNMVPNIVRSDPLKLITARTFLREFPNAVVYVDEKDGTVLRDLWVWELDRDKRVVRAHHAQEGELAYNEESHKLVLKVREGTTELRDRDDPEAFNKVVTVSTFGSAEFEFSLSNLFGRITTRQKLDWMTLEELKAQREQLTAAPDADTPEGQMRRMQVDVTLNKKAANALAVLAFALIGVPLGIKVSRRETSANLGMALLLILIYYMLSGVAGWLEAYPRWRPDLIVWVPPLLFAGFGAWLLSRLGRMK